MIRALLLLFDPVAAWERVVEAKRSILTIILISLLPLFLLVCAGQGYALANWGKQRGDFGKAVTLTLPLVIQYALIWVALALAAVFVGAFLVKAIGETFHGRHSYAQAFTVVAYGLTPLFTMQLLNMIPRDPWWLTWAIGIVLSLSTFYTGIPVVMRPDPAHALGLYFMSALVLVIITGLTSFMTYMALDNLFMPGNVRTLLEIGRLVAA